MKIMNFAVSTFSRRSVGSPSNSRLFSSLVRHQQSSYQSRTISLLVEQFQNHYASQKNQHVAIQPLILTGQTSILRGFSTTTTTATPTMPSSDPSASASKKDGETDEKHKEEAGDSKLSTNPTFKTMVRNYGPLFIGTYFAVYFSTWGSIFAGIESGAFDPAYILSFIVDNNDSKTTAQLVLDLLKKYPWTQPAVPYVEANPSVANLAVAWIATKPTEPIRFGITVAALPRLGRWFGYNKNTSTPSSDSDDSDKSNKDGDKSSEKS
mmetsp:Transcript_35019/g.84744  ORF Transcript_35019/g.84744 Transcript_35019/m.84744 type:complete len:266 (-) Transcript_35019:1362-2159(-)